MNSNNLLRASKLILLFFLIPVLIMAQVSDDFEGGALNGWYSEGDGSSSLDDSFGNPGASFKVNDNATGSINYAIAPVRYLGDWSSASADDSLTVDVYVASSISKPIKDSNPIFEIVGPGGRAIALNGVNLPPNAWHHIGISLNPAEWTVTTGTWQGLIANVQLLRIRAEHIEGNESVFLDNVELTIPPLRQDINGYICTDFESGTVEGWDFVGIGGLTIDEMNGNPNYCVDIGDKSGDIGEAIAPPKFYGDWSSLKDSSKISFDLKITNSSDNLLSKQYLVRLTGNNSVAEALPHDSILSKALDKWYTFSFPIDPDSWTIQSGTWNNLIQDVQEIRLEIEFIYGGEDVLLDNFCLYADTTSSTVHVKQLALYGGIDIYPNPANDYLNFEAYENSSIEIYSVLGVSVLSKKINAGNIRINISNLSAGAYFIKIGNKVEPLIVK